MTLLPGEKGFLSGSWDGTVREWDLNTGTTVRQYPTHGAQISSISLRPYAPPSPSPSPRIQPTEDNEEGGNGGTGLNVSVTVGPDFDKRGEAGRQDAAASSPKALDSAAGDNADGDKAAGADVVMSDAPSPFDPLFDEDAEGETVPPSADVTVPPSPGINDMAPPAPSPKPVSSGLALPGMNGIISNGQNGVNGTEGIKNEIHPPTSAPSTATTPLFNLPQPVASTSRQAASTIPLLSATSYKAFSDDVFLTSSMDGQVVLVDRRVPDYSGTSAGVGRLTPGEKAPPWCMSVSRRWFWADSHTLP